MVAMPVVKVIYGRPMLPDLARVLACLYEKGIKFELEDMNKGKKMTQDIINLQISSHGNTPGLQDGTEELFGSRKICKRIAEKYREYGYQYLLGNDPLARASVEQWIQSEEIMFDPPSSALVFYLAYNIESDKEKRSKSEKKLATILNLYEQRLGEFEFLAGNYFTLADLNHLPNTYYLENSDEYGYLFKDRKNISRWWKNISGRDSWKNVLKKCDEEGLQFKNLEFYTETDLGGIKKESKADIPDNESGKGDKNVSENKGKPSFSPEMKKDGAVNSKTESREDESQSGHSKEATPSKKAETKSESKKDAVKRDEKDTEGKKDAYKFEETSNRGKKDSEDKNDGAFGRAEPDNQVNKGSVQTEGKKDAHKSGESDNKKGSAPTDPGTEGKNDGTRGPTEPDNQGNKGSAQTESEKNTHTKKGSAPTDPVNEDKKDTTDGKAEGKKDEQTYDATKGKKDRTHDAAEQDTQGNKKSPPTEGEKGEPNSDESNNQGNNGSVPNVPATEGKKDELEQDDKDKSSSTKEKEPDQSKMNEKGAVGNDGKEKASSSSSNNNNPIPTDEKERSK